MSPKGIVKYWEMCYFSIFPIPATAKSLQSCPTLCDLIDGSPPGSSIHGIFQARVLEWGAIAFSLSYTYRPLILNSSNNLGSSLFYSFWKTSRAEAWDFGCTVESLRELYKNHWTWDGTSRDSDILLGYRLNTSILKFPQIILKCSQSSEPQSKVLRIDFFSYRNFFHSYS